MASSEEPWLTDIILPPGLGSLGAYAPAPGARSFWDGGSDHDTESSAPWDTGSWDAGSSSDFESTSGSESSSLDYESGFDSDVTEASGSLFDYDTSGFIDAPPPSAFDFHYGTATVVGAAAALTDDAAAARYLPPPSNAPWQAAPPADVKPPKPTMSPKIGLAGLINTGDEPIVCPLCERGCEQHHRLGFHWGKFGYTGPPYCSRCSSVFRAHIIKRTVSADCCGRAAPCVSCLTVLRHFSGPREEAYACMDRSAASRPPTDRSEVETARARCEYCDSWVLQSAMGLFWCVKSCRSVHRSEVHFAVLTHRLTRFTCVSTGGSSGTPVSPTAGTALRAFEAT